MKYLVHQEGFQFKEDATLIPANELFDASPNTNFEDKANSEEGEERLLMQNLKMRM